MHSLRATLLGSILTLGLLGAAPARGDNGKIFAVVIGIDEYVHDSIPKLRYAVADAKLFAQALQDVIHVPKEQVILMTSDSVDETLQPKVTNVAFRLGGLQSLVKPDDTIIFYFAGHGLSMDTDSYLLTQEADNRNAATLKFSALRGSDLTDLLRAAQPARVIVVVDACRNNPTKPTAALSFTYPTLGAATGKRESATLFSCSVGERSWEWDERKHGFFTYYLVQGLRKEAADSEGQVTLGNLHTYLGQEVPKSCKLLTSAIQTPTFTYQGPGPESWVLAHIAPSGPRVASGGVKKDADDSKFVAQLEAERARADREVALRKAAEARADCESSKRIEIEQRLAILEKQIPVGKVAAQPSGQPSSSVIAYADRGVYPEEAKNKALEAEVARLKAENESLRARLTALQGGAKQVGMVTASSREVTLVEKEISESETGSRSVPADSSKDRAMLEQQADRQMLNLKLKLVETQLQPALDARAVDENLRDELALMRYYAKIQRLETMNYAAQAGAAEAASKQAATELRVAQIRSRESVALIQDLRAELVRTRSELTIAVRELETLREENTSLRKEVAVLGVEVSQMKANPPPSNNNGPHFWKITGPHHQRDYVKLNRTDEATQLPAGK